MLCRLIKAFVKKYIKKETILPKDLWKFKGIVCGGTDTHTFKDKIEYYWGKRPIEIYGGTEIATVATETWGDSGLTFFADVNFLEFIPEKDSLRSVQDKDFIPQTLLLNELKPNERYELVTTKFRGGAFIRYRVGDIIECLSLDNKAYNINLPQIRFVDRISNVIDIGGFTRITKATIDKAISLGNICVKNWVACKEFDANDPVLHLYVEMEGENHDIEVVKESFDKWLQESDCDYRDFHKLLGRDPLRFTLLKVGTFKAYESNNTSPLIKMNPDKQTITNLTIA